MPKISSLEAPLEVPEFTAEELRLIARRRYLAKLPDSAPSLVARRKDLPPVNVNIPTRQSDYRRAPRITESDRGRFMKDGETGDAAIKDVKDNYRMGILSSSVPAQFKNKLESEADILNSYWGWIGIVEPEYDLLEPFTILDTEAFFYQAIKRKLSLMFRNGMTFTGKNTKWVEYAQKRMNQMSFVTNYAMESLFQDILQNLLLCSNCFLLKIRDKKASGGIANEKNSKKVPVAGYKIVPPQTLFPFLNGRGQVEFYRRFFGSGRPYKDYELDDIVHFYWDRKPGQLFGTPRTAPVRDDIYALRRLEENLELLLIHHLFPLYHLKVGTEAAPCEYTPDGSSEADYIRAAVQNMPKEGVLVTDERVEIEVHGSQGEAMNTDSIIKHYKQRIFTGLGVSPLDMGETDTGGKGTAENVSQNLKDSIKADLDWFTRQVSMLMLKEWFQESSYDMSVQNAVADTKIEFHEIDVDTQIKKDTHATNLFNNNVISRNEARQSTKRNPMTPEEDDDTNFQHHTMSLEKFRHESGMEQMQRKAELQPAAPPPDKKGSKKKGESKKNKITAKHGGARTVSKKPPPANAVGSAAASPAGSARAIAVRIKPENQHGVNLDPHKARSSAEMTELIYDRIRENPEDLAAFYSTLEFSPALQQTLNDFVRTAADHDMLYSMIAALFSDESVFPERLLEGDEDTVSDLQMSDQL